ncbi:MAG: S41 family peptidase [Phycisphaerales bacterium]
MPSPASTVRALAAAISLGALSAAFGAPGNVGFPRYPSISPDGKTVVFSWRGDLWSVPASGGTAARLTSHSANDLRSAFSPDGRTIAFNSARLGGGNIFLMNADGSNVRPITFSDRVLQLAGFNADGTRVLFSAAREGDQYRAVRPYTVSTQGGAIERLLDCFGETPQVSPDGKRIVFERGGSEWSRRHYRGPDSRDLWLYDISGKSFTRLTTWAGNDGKAQWRDNNTIVYLSDRELDTVNLWSMTIDGGESKARRLTGFQGVDVHDVDVAVDAGVAVFSSWDTLSTLDLGAAAPAARVLTINAAEDEQDNVSLRQVGKDVSQAALSPDGKTMAVIAYGQVYVRGTEDKSPTRRVTPADWKGRCREPAWSADGVTLYFSSDADGTDAIYKATVEKTRDEVKEEFKKASKPEEKKPDEPKVQEPEGAAPPPVKEGEAAAGGADAAADAKDGAKKEEKKDEPDFAKQAERWSKALRFKVETVNTSRKPGDNDRMPALSPDGKTMVFRRGRGDIVAMDLASGTVRTMLSSWDYGNEFRISPDSRFIAWSASDDDFNADLWIAPLDGSKPPANVTRHPDIDGAPRWSADSKVLAFLSEREGDLDVYAVYLDKELESLSTPDLEKYYKDAVDAAKKRKPLNHEKKKDEKKDAKDGGKDGSKEEKKAETPPSAPAAAATPAPAAAPADPATAPATPAPAPATEPAAALAAEAKKDDKKDEKKEETKEPPFEPDLDDAYLRIKRITTLNGNEGNLEITPGGDRLIFTGNDGGDGGQGLYSVKWNGDEKERKRLMEGEPRVQMVSLTGDKLVIVDKGSTSTIPPEGGKTESQAIEDRARVDLQAQAAQKFTEAARVLGELFYHPTMKDLDWKSLSERYLTLAKQTRTGEEFAYVALRLMGELNGSHLGVFTPPEPAPLAETVGRLGIDAFAAQAPERVFQVSAVVPLGPASIGPMALRAGDMITAIDDEPFAETDSLESRLRGKVGKEVSVTFKRQLKDGEPRAELSALFTPIAYERETDLRYDWWVKRNADLVSEWSGGKLGYLHIRGMSEPSLVTFERDLYAAAHNKGGLLVDVRSNGGGWTADRILVSLVTPAHAYTVPRGGSTNPDAYPRDRLFIQKYTKPVNMLCNEKSFSNAEIVSHAFKHLKRGTLCGQQTYGGVISTDAFTLVDGTGVRLPFRGWYTFDGKDMENNGAMPDLVTVQTPEDETAGFDRQLKEAVEDLMKRVP